MMWLSNIINKFIDWAIRLGRDMRRYSKNPNNQVSHFSPPPRVRRRIVKMIDRKLFGIGRKASET